MYSQRQRCRGFSWNRRRYVRLDQSAHQTAGRRQFSLRFSTEHIFCQPFNSEGLGSTGLTGTVKLTDLVPNQRLGKSLSC